MMLSEARDARYLAKARLDAKHEKAAPPAPLKPKDPRIGILMRKGKPVYYAYLGKRYIENPCLDLVERELEGK
jgi:hypothetical protein